MPVTRGPIDITKRLVDFLPDTLTTEEGDAFSLVWSDEEEDVALANLVFPYGSIKRGVKKRMFSDENAGDLKITANQVDTIAFSSGTDVYQVTERDIDSVNTLTATVGGTANTTLVEGTDFEIHTTADYNTENAIKFLDGGTKPDDSTSFTVDYEHTRVEEHHTDTYQIPYRIIIHTKEATVGGNFYFKSRLSDQLMQALLSHLTTKRGATLGNVGDGLSIHGFEPLPAQSISDSETVARAAVDVMLVHTQTTKTLTTEYIGKVDDPDTTVG